MIEAEFKLSRSGCGMDRHCGAVISERRKTEFLEKELERLTKDHSQISKAFSEMLTHVAGGLDSTESAEHAYNYFVSNLIGVDKIERVYIKKENGVIRFVVITEDRDIDIEDKIISTFLEVIEESPNFLFDFKIIPRLDREFKDIELKDAHLLYEG